MMTENDSSGGDTQLDAQLMARLADGDQQALGALFDRDRDRLWRMVQFRMDRRLRARIDPDDVLQEAFVNAAARVHHYLAEPGRSLFVWLRLIVGQTLIDVHRRHLLADMRDIDREVSVGAMRYPQATSVALAAELAGNQTSPSQAAVGNEVSSQLETALASMSEIDQEIIALRHFEDLTNREVAEVLEIGITAASNRYVRALARLREILATLSDFE